MRKMKSVLSILVIFLCAIVLTRLSWASTSAQELYEQARSESLMFKKLEIYNEALDMDKGFLDARKDRAFILYYQGKHKEALEDLTVCLENGLDGADIRAMRAKVLIALKKYKEAREDLSRAIEHYGQSRELILDRALTNVKLKNYDEALKDLKLLIKENYSDRISNQAYRLMGEIFLSQGESEIAREYFAKAGGWDGLWGISFPGGIYSAKLVSLLGMLGIMVSCAALIFKVDLPAPKHPRRRRR